MTAKGFRKQHSKEEIDEVLNEASKYQVKERFAEGSKTHYRRARAWGIMGQACAHMSPPFRWTVEKVHADALRYNSKSEFERHSPGGYWWASKEGVLDSVCSHMEKKYSYWSGNFDAIRDEAEKYETRSAFKIGSRGAYAAAVEMGILEEVAKPNIRKYWSDADLIEVAANYKSRKKFSIAHPSAAQLIFQRGIEDLAFSHFEFEGYGFDATKAAILYYLRISTVIGDVYKIGITNRTVFARFPSKEDQTKITILMAKPFAIGADAHKEEQAIKRAHKADRFKGKCPLIGGGATEMFSRDVLGLDMAVTA